MTVLCDWEIRSLCEQSQMVWPFRADLLNPASLDLVLGNEIMIEVADQRELVRMSIAERTAEDPYSVLATK